MQRFLQRSSGHYGLIALAAVVCLLPHSLSARAATGVASDDGTVFHHKFADGDSLAAVFARYGVPDDDLIQLLAAQNVNTQVRTLEAGQIISLSINRTGRLTQFRIGERGTNESITLRRTENSFERRLTDGDFGAAADTQSTAPRSRGYHALVTIARGDSLYGIFKRLDLPQGDLARLMNSGKLSKKLRTLKPNQTLRFRMLADGGLDELLYELNSFESIAFVRKGDMFHTETIKREANIYAESASGQIVDSLYSAATTAGIPEQLTMNLVNIFAWDVDFAKDIRGGDAFSMIYETHMLDGKIVKVGDILAAQFVNQGNTYRAVRFVFPDGRVDYFTPEGKPLRRAFIRSPVPFARISSKFNLRRRHPILHKIRAHKGVDYAAPTGTRVNATGDGYVAQIGRKGGYGRTVVLRHGGSKYSTLYAHLSRYARNLRVGSRVKQGQVIGYVGRSGLATGPHLHYEFRVNGAHRNPLTVPLPRALPIARVHKPDFEAQTRPLLAKLDQIAPLVVADSN